MKFTFKSEHEYGTTVEMTFDEEHIDEIEDMFKLFLRGSGFHIQDEEEEPQHLVKSCSGVGSWAATSTSCSLHPDAPHGYDRDRSVNEHRNVCKCESWEPPMPKEPISATADKSEISGIADEYTYTTLSTAKVWLEADWYTPEELQTIVDFKTAQEELLRESMGELPKEKNSD